MPTNLDQFEPKLAANPSGGLPPGAERHGMVVGIKQTVKSGRLVCMCRAFVRPFLMHYRLDAYRVSG